MCVSKFFVQINFYFFHESIECETLFLDFGSHFATYTLFCYHKTFSWTCSIYDSTIHFYILIYWCGHFGWFSATSFGYVSVRDGRWGEKVLAGGVGVGVYLGDRIVAVAGVMSVALKENLNALDCSSISFKILGNYQHFLRS